jgi:eukaryotic-like serine/threonine-protein kinase
MPEPADLERLLSALRAGLINPARLASELAAWPAARRAELAALLEAQGVVTGEYDALPGTITASFEPVGTDPDATTDHVSTPAPGGTTETATVAPAGAAPAAGHSRTARYQLVRVHRCGGLGQVWIARDTAIGRDVALKTLRPDRRTDPGARARFVREARVTGRLEHPCVVPLYDLIDRPGSQPFYAMRFVAGRTLAEAVEAYHQARAAGRAGPLDLAALLDAFVAVCRAVAFAHARGVLHRDLKGHNVVLGDYGEVFLLDWGLAKKASEPDPPGAAALDDDGQPDLTRPGAPVGTPGFLAPEVAAGGAATTASDVYGLGAILYTILTGKVPYEGATATEVIGKVAAAGPPPAGAVNPAAPPALVAICRRAMARRPADRYPSADALATDVRRWLADEPVAAYPDPFLARVGRWARRHRPAVAAAAVFLVTAVAALAASTALIAREERRTAEQRDVARREWDRAEEERRQAETARARADANFHIARELAFSISGKIFDLETGRTDTRATDAARLRLLDEAGNTFDQLRTALPEDAALARQAANIHRFRANVARTLNRTDEARRAYQASIDLWQWLVDRRPDDPDPVDNLGQTLRDYAMYLKRIGKLRDAAATIDRACEMAAGQKGRLPERSYARSLGVAEIGRSEVAYLLGDFAAAEKAAARAAELLAVLEKPAPGNLSQPADPLMIAIAFTDLAKAAREQDRPADALTQHDRACEVLRELLDGPLDPNVRLLLCGARTERALTLDRIDGKRAEAVADLAEVTREAAALAEKYPDVAFYKESLAAAHLHRAELLIRLGKPDEAEAELKQALAVTRVLIDRSRNDPVPEVLRLRAWTYLRLGQLSAAAGRAGDAAKEIANAAIIFKLALKNDPDNVHHGRGLEATEREAAGKGP